MMVISMEKRKGGEGTKEKAGREVIRKGGRGFLKNILRT